MAGARAVTAADAAALAGAAAGREAARSAAEDNGGRLVGYEQLGADTRVQVVLDGARAVARARRESTGPGPGRVAPGLRAALARASQLLGTVVPAAPVGAGASTGEAALAVEVPASFVARLVGVAPQAGLCRPSPDARPFRFQLCA